MDNARWKKKKIWFEAMDLPFELSSPGLKQKIVLLHSQKLYATKGRKFTSMKIIGI